MHGPVLFLFTQIQVVDGVYKWAVKQIDEINSIKSLVMVLWKATFKMFLTNNAVYDWSLMLHNVTQKEESTFSWEIKEEDREEKMIVPYLLENAPED